MGHPGLLMSSISFAVVRSLSSPSHTSQMGHPETALSERREHLRGVLGNLARQISTAVELPEQRLPEMVSSGVGALDALTGGLPRGAITEITGTASSGRTTLVLAALAAATRRQETCALIDAMDCFDPESAAAAGVELARVLWIRCNGELPQKEGVAAKFITNDFGNHEWVAESQRRKPSAWEQKRAPLYRRLEQALRAADLLLQGGGFGMVVLDLGGLPVDVARRVPMTTWFRFKRAIEPTPATLIAVQAASLAQGCAALALNVHSHITIDSKENLLRGMDIHVEAVRAIGMKKNVQKETRVEARTFDVG